MPQFGGKNAKKKSSSSSTKRHFTVVMGNKEHGLYVSSSPSSAARKAVSKLCATDKKKKVDFSIREITQGSKKKTYGPYKGYIEKLKEPIELKGRVIRYKPVAKLSGKTGKKMKGGMRGGAKIYECYTKMSGTEYTFKIEKELVPNNNNNRSINNNNNSSININNNNSSTMHNQYVLTLINNKVNKVPEPESMDIHWFDAYTRSQALIDIIKIKNNDYRIIFNDDDDEDEVRKVLDNFLRLYYTASGTLGHRLIIKDNVTVVSVSGKEVKPKEDVNQESWLKRIFIWLNR